ncbi:MAG: hypothetical protein PHH91_00545 [Desulfuromonadaceae bacterium]|nr:hypothetical protein [Desulfuromonadaceae bacterium]
MIERFGFDADAFEGVGLSELMCCWAAALQGRSSAAYGVSS